MRLSINSNKFRPRQLPAVVLLCCVAFLAGGTALAQDSAGYSPEALQELAGPIALYPDDLLGIVLSASAYPLQLVQAAQFLEDYENDAGLKPDESWDESVVALLNYPEVVAQLNEDLVWTEALGEVAEQQQADLLAAIQAFRKRAVLAGNLRSDDRQRVRIEDDIIYIEPVEADAIYIPDYEPERVVVHHRYPVYRYYPYRRPVYYYPYPAHYSFHSGFFWGVTTVFAIGWHDFGLRLHSFGHRHHPYYGRRYARQHYYFHPPRHRDRPRRVVRAQRRHQLANHRGNRRLAGSQLRRHRDADHFRGRAGQRRADRNRAVSRRGTNFRQRAGGQRFSAGARQTGRPREGTRNRRPLRSDVGRAPTRQAFDADRRQNRRQNAGAGQQRRFDANRGTAQRRQARNERRSQNRQARRANPRRDISTERRSDRRRVAPRAQPANQRTANRQGQARRPAPTRRASNASPRRQQHASAPRAPRAQQRNRVTQNRPARARQAAPARANRGGMRRGADRASRRANHQRRAGGRRAR